MNESIKEIAERLRGLREILEFSIEDMAEATDVTPEQYQAYESGEQDFSVTFLGKCAAKFKVDIVELLSGSNPKLKSYSVVRKGQGLSVTRRASFQYQHLAYKFSGKLADPYLVEAPYIEEQQNAPITMSQHEGQEFDYILSGTLKIIVNGKEKILNEGDAIYYDSSKPHGMIAVSKDGCRFLAYLVK
jgi:transcriptional regulator with XRE-family HTH domain